MNLIFIPFIMCFYHSFKGSWIPLDMHVFALVDNSFVLRTYLAWRHGEWCKWKLTKTRVFTLRIRKQNGAAFTTWPNMMHMRNN